MGTLSPVSYGIWGVIFLDIALMLAYDGPPPGITIIYRRKQENRGSGVEG